MKKGKLLILLVAMLSLAILFAACEESSAVDSTEETVVQTETPTDSGTEAVTEAPTEEVAGTDVSDELKYADHEMRDYFDLSDKEKTNPVALASKIDGELLSVDDENSLVVVVTKTVDALDYETKTVKVYDLLTGEVIREDSVKSPYGGYPREEAVAINVTLHYPVIRVEKTTYVAQGEGEAPKQHKEVSYYIAEKDGELVYTTSDTSFDMYEYGNGLVCFLMGDKYVWVDRDMNVIRSVETIAANYDYAINPNMFNSEYKGYLYSYNATDLMVFNHSGVVSAKYSVGQKDTYIKCFVLDDGNVLVQEFTDVGAYNSCDFALNGTRYTMKSMIVNAVTGTVTDIELDLVIGYLESEYEQECAWYTPALKLANGRDNLVVAYNVANGSVSAYASICVMDNTGKIVYTVKNDTFGVDFQHGIQYIGREMYIATMNTNGYSWDAIFDIDGNFISAYNSDVASITDKYIVSNTAIYAYDMGLVYDFAADGYSSAMVMGNQVYLVKTNYVSGNIEVYRYVGLGQAELFSADVESEFCYADNDFFILYNEDADVYTVYNAAGEELIVSYEYLNPQYAGNDITLLQTYFEGERIVYVLK